MRDTIKMGNDEFILFVRKQNTNNSMPNDRLGRKIWEWIEANDKGVARQLKPEMQCLWENNSDSRNIDCKLLPKTATQFEFSRDLLPELYLFLETI